MITRDWNHPSIVIWGVRINESQDDHDFYAETNRLAHELDAPARRAGCATSPTARCSKTSTP
jgi:beta-galactosidase